MVKALNKSLMTNRRCPTPPGAKEKVGRLLTVHLHSHRRSHILFVQGDHKL